MGVLEPHSLSMKAAGSRAEELYCGEGGGHCVSNGNNKTSLAWGFINNGKCCVVKVGLKIC